jgi:hypothetical protein
MDSQADQPFGDAEPPSGDPQPFGGQQPDPGAQPNPGQWQYPGQPQDPGQQQYAPTQPYPGQPQDPGQQQYAPTQPYPGQPQDPGQQAYPGQQQYPGQQAYPGQPQDPAQQYPGQQAYPGQQPYPGQQAYPGQYPGQQYGGPSPYGPQMAGGRPKVRPGRIWYLAALAVFIGGVIWVVVGAISVNNQVNAFPRVALPGGGAVTLNHSGGYVIYYEGPGAQSGQIPSFNVRIVAAAPPARVGSLKSYSGSVTYSFGSRQGRAVLNFQVAHPGRFLVEPSGAPGSGSDLAFGSSILGGLLTAILPAIGLILLGIAAWVVLLIVRIVRTRRARTMAMQPPAWQ